MPDDSGDKSWADHMKNIHGAPPGKSVIENNPELAEALEPLVKQAKSDTVTAERLVGDEGYFHNVLPYLEEGEQPHFLFPLTKGFFAESVLIVESGAAQQELLDNKAGGVCLVSDRYVRIHSSKGEWTIPYNSITSVDFVGHPSLHVQTSGRTYYIQIAGTVFDEEETLSVAASYIREQQREAVSESSGSTGNDPIEKLEKLGELRDNGVLSEQEFQQKKSDLLDEI